MKTVHIGWIGVGVMGHSMVGHLCAAGYPVTLYTRTQAKAADLLAKGAQWAQTPKEVAEASDVVFSMVGFPSDVESVLLGEEGALKGLRAGGVLCDMTTSSPTLAEKVAQEALKKGCLSLDCPVTGGDIGAKNATLSIFVGGDEQALNIVRPCLECMGKTILHCGGCGQGQRAKLANQVAIAGVMFSTCESLLFAKEAGLDVRKWLEAVVAGAAGSVALNTLGRRVLDGDVDPGFFIKHFVKDLGLCLEECNRMGLVLPGMNAALAMYRLLMARGAENRGTQFLTQGLAELCGKDWQKV